MSQRIQGLYEKMVTTQLDELETQFLNSNCEIQHFQVTWTTPISEA